MEACRVRALFRGVVWSSLQKFRRCSTSSSSSTAWARARSVFSDDPEGGGSVYHHALKYQRPVTWTKYTQQLHNSVSFIGTIDRLRESDSQYGDSGTYTLLTVKTSPDSNRSFKILLNMRDEMAEICIKHLKPSDFIYVSGRLGSYTKVDGNGKLGTYYQVTVNDIKFVAHNGQSPTCQKSEQSETRGIGRSPTCQKSENQKREIQAKLLPINPEKPFHLWQEFFANQYEWRDFRKREVNPNHPDFKHEDTGEAIWLKSNDPPWIKKQKLRNDFLFGWMKEKRSSRQLTGFIGEKRRESFKSFLPLFLSLAIVAVVL